LNATISEAEKLIENKMSQRLKKPFYVAKGTQSEIKKLLNKLRNKWQEARRTESMFLERSKDWLNVKILLSNKNAEDEPPRDTY
jgi:hypothetical protein